MTAATMRRQALARVVLTLLLAAALAPTLSRALAHVRGVAAPWAQGCATAGPVQAAARPAPAVTDAWQHLLAHCPLCSLGPDLPDGLPLAAVPLPLPTLADAGPPAKLATPGRSAPPRWRALPRAPPTLS